MEPTNISTVTAALRRKSAEAIEKMITITDAMTENMCEVSWLFKKLVLLCLHSVKTFQSACDLDS